MEVFHNNAWGTVCDDLWSTEDANVVCRQLGLPYGAARALSNAHFGQGSGQIWMDYVECVGTENKLEECTQNFGHGWGSRDCSHSEDAGVHCVNRKCVLVNKIV